MRTIIRMVTVGSILACGLMLTVSTSSATAEYTKKEKKPCTYCHPSSGSKELNDAGKYYAEHNHSLEGYKPKK